mgnify:CR=1 FL=1
MLPSVVARYIKGQSQREVVDKGIRPAGCETGMIPQRIAKAGKKCRCTVPI